MREKQLIAVFVSTALILGGITAIPAEKVNAAEIVNAAEEVNALEEVNASEEVNAAEEVHVSEGVNASEADMQQTVIDFEDRGGEEQALTGIYGGCDFGTGGFFTGAAGGNVKLWSETLTKDAQVSKIAIPYGKIFRGFSAFSSSGATVKVVSGSESNTFSVGTEEQDFITDFNNDEMAVYLVMESQGGSSEIKLDNLILEDVDITKLNVSQNKPVTTSGDNQRPASNGNDGNYDTMWINNGPGADKWWQVDLGQDYDLLDFELTFEKDESNPWKYKIEGSSDGVNFTMLTDRTENTNGNKTQTGVFPENTKFQYVRVTITGLPAETYWCGFAEFKVFTDNQLSNVALHKNAEQSGGSNAPGLAVDGDTKTFSGNTGSFPYWWTVDLGSAYNVKKLEIEWEDLKDKDIDLAEDWKYTIEYSGDGGENWVTAVDYSQESPYTDPASSLVQTADVDIECSKIRVTITGKPSQRPFAWAIIPEFRAFAVDTSVPTEAGQDLNLDLAFGQPVEASSTAENYKGEAVTDNDPATSWKPAASEEPAYLQIDLGREFNIRNHKVEFAENTSKNDYQFMVSSDNENWTILSEVSGQTAEEKIKIPETPAKYVRFLFTNPSADLEVTGIHFDGLDAGVPSGKNILILAPHQDDEMLMAGGIIKRAVDAGDNVKVLLATNGDYNGQGSGQGRIVESINALNALGLTKDNIMFLGYADTGGLGGTQTYWDSFLYKLYTAEDDTVFTSRFGNQYSYGNPDIKQDYRFELTGEHSLYTRANFVNDLKDAIINSNATDIYVPSRYDMHFDHAYLDLFAIEAIQSIKRDNPSYNPTLHESIIHSCAGDGNWPVWNSDEAGIQAHKMPQGLEDLTMLQWSERENVNVPYSMRQTPFSFNLKDQALRLYTSQYYGYIGSFAKVNEIFWTRDFTSFAMNAVVTASSEMSNTDRKLDQSAVKAIDGVLDGEAGGLPYGHMRFAHAEWVTNQETAGAWINLDFQNKVDMSLIKLYDRPDMDNQITGGKLIFDDGSEIEVGELPNNGRPLEIPVNKNSRSVKFVITSVSGSTTSTGLAEIEVE